MEKDEILKWMISDIKDFKSKNPSWVVIIRWATATWKTWFSISLADYFDVEIISSDSRQIYKYMDIWTDKISIEYRNKIPHYMIDIIEPDVIYTAWEWKMETEKIVDNILSRNKLPIIVGWTWLYIDMIYKNFTLPNVEPDYTYRDWLEKLEFETPWFLHNKLLQVDPCEAEKLHPKSTRHIIRALEIFEKTWKTKTELASQQPVKWPLLMIGLRREKDDTNRRINSRIKEMFDLWLVDEVKSLLDRGYDISLPAMLWIWYKEVIWYLEKDYDLERAQELLKRNTHHYAKRQRTWFRRYIWESKAMPKENVTYKLYML